MKMLNYKLILIVGGCAFLGAVGQIFFSRASKDISFNVFELLKNYNLFIGLILYGLATIVYIFALKYGDLSQLYPVIALSYVFVVILSNLILLEQITLPKIIGSLGIVLSVYIIARG